MKYGLVDRSAVWSSYLANLRYVLEEVELLLSNVDAETAVITADHGNAFGEFGVYGHPSGLLHPDIRRVPWVTTTGTDGGGFDPSPPLAQETVDSDTEQLLRDLGYRE